MRRISQSLWKMVVLWAFRALNRSIITNIKLEQQKATDPLVWKYLSLCSPFLPRSFPAKYVVIDSCCSSGLTTSCFTYKQNGQIYFHTKLHCMGALGSA